MELNSLVEESEKNNYITFRLHKKVAGLLLFILLMIALFIGYRAGTQYNNGDDGVVVISPIPTYSEKYIPRTPTKIPPENLDIPHDIPTSIDAKYNEVETIYKDSLGAGIKYCSNGIQQIYQIWGSGGYTGVMYYYSLDGTYLGEETFTDVLTDGDNGKNNTSDITIAEYSCVDMRVSGDGPFPPPDSPESTPKPTKKQNGADIYAPIP